jgi:hypothetical protein
MRRYEEFKRHESVKLVKEYLTCTDELTSICMVLQGKAETLKQLLKNVEQDEEAYAIQHGLSRRMSRQRSQGERPPGSCETMKERLTWALAHVEDQQRTFQSLLEDLRLATEAVSRID